MYTEYDEEKKGEKIRHRERGFADWHWKKPPEEQKELKLTTDGFQTWKIKWNMFQYLKNMKSKHGLKHLEELEVNDDPTNENE